LTKLTLFYHESGETYWLDGDKLGFFVEREKKGVADFSLRLEME